MHETTSEQDKNTSEAGIYFLGGILKVNEAIDKKLGLVTCTQKALHTTHQAQSWLGTQ